MESHLKLWSRKIGQEMHQMQLSEHSSLNAMLDETPWTLHTVILEELLTRSSTLYM